MEFETQDFEMAEAEEPDNLGESFDSDLDAPEKKNNRTFMVAAGALGAVALLILGAIAVYALWLLPQQKQQQAFQVATLDAQNTQVAFAITMTSVPVIPTQTATNTPLPATPTVAPTKVVAAAAQPMLTPTQDVRTATVAALLTQAAQTPQVVAPTATALPSTGFADEFGLPLTLGVALLLLVVGFVARRMRSAS